MENINHEIAGMNIHNTKHFTEYRADSFKIKFQIPICILAIVALLCNIFQTFLQLDDNGLIWKMSFGWEEIVGLLLGIVPNLILFFYVLILYHYSSCVFMIPLLFGIQLFAYIVYAVMVIVEHPFVTNIVIFSIAIVLFGCMFIGSLSGFQKKMLLVIPIVINMVYLLYSQVQIIININYNSIANILYSLSSILSILCFNCALLLFVSKNRIIMHPSTISDSGQNSIQTTEEKLLSLKSEYENGLISEEEYCKRRTIIIDEL